MLDEKIHATRRERNLVRLTIDPAEGMVLCGAVKRTVGIVRDKVARGRRCDVVDDLFSHRGNANQSRCLQKSFFFSRMVCTDHIDHDSHILGFGLTDQILQIGFASERFIQRVDVLKKDHHIAKYQRCTRDSQIYSEHRDSPGSSNHGTTRQETCSLRYSRREDQFGLTISPWCRTRSRIKKKRCRTLTETMGEIQIYDDREARRISKWIKLCLHEKRWRRPRSRLTTSKPMPLM